MEEPLNGTSDETISPSLEDLYPEEKQPEPPKELSPEEKADLEKNRLQFRTMHDAIADLDIYEAEAVLGMITGSITNAYQNYQANVEVSVLELGEIDEKAQRVVDLVKELDVQRVLVYTNALHNAINQHKYVKTKNWTVKELDIELL